MKRLSTIVIYILAILSAELLVEHAKHLIHIKTGTSSAYINTLIGMAVIVTIFYPLVLLAEWLLEIIAEKIVHQSKHTIGSEILGLLVSFIVGFGILFLIYLKMWYGKTLW
jgi:hypothetical protein